MCQLCENDEHTPGCTKYPHITYVFLAILSETPAIEVHFVGLQLLTVNHLLLHHLLDPPLERDYHRTTVSPILFEWWPIFSTTGTLA